MHHDGTAATAMLGLPGFVLLAVSEHDDELEYAIETPEAVTGCPACGVVARLHDRRRTDVRDLPAGGRPVTLVWLKRVWRCHEPDCPRQTWTETSEAIRPRASLTERARREACRRVGQDGETVARVAAQYGIGWQTIMNAVREYGLPLVEEPARIDGVKRLGVDETAFLAANAHRAARLAFAAVDEVRRRVQQDSTAHRGRNGDPLYGIRRLPRRRADRLSEHAWARLLAGLDAGDVNEQIGLTWIAAQDLCRLYQCRTRFSAEQHLHRWLTHCADADVPELKRLARTLDSWRTELLAYFDTGGISNGPTEAINGLIKKIKRVGHGYRNFDNYRLRLLLHCGLNWQTPQPARIRGRLPRLAA